MVVGALLRVMVPVTPVMSTMAEFEVSALTAAIASRREQLPLPPGLFAGQLAAVPVAGSVVTVTVKVSVAAEALVAGARNKGASQTRLAKRKDRTRKDDERRGATTGDIHSTSQEIGSCSAARHTGLAWRSTAIQVRN